jgi:hypothetical protein
MTGTIRLPDATREAQLEAHNIRPDHVGSRSVFENRREDLAGGNGNSPTRPVHRPDRLYRAAIGLDDGWGRAYPGGAHDGGMVAHRGVVHPDEYVDAAALKAAVCERLGFTATEIRAVYRQGPLSPEARTLRDRIDLRLLELSESGGLMVELGRALGWAVKDNGSCRIMENALGRARMRHRGPKAAA